MQGSAMKLINMLIQEKTKGDPVMQNAIKVKLMLGGIPINKLNDSTPDDPVLNEKIRKVAADYGVAI